MFNMIVNIQNIMIWKKNKLKNDFKCFDMQICIKLNWYRFLHVCKKKQFIPIGFKNI